MGQQYVGGRRNWSLHDCDIARWTELDSRGFLGGIHLFRRRAWFGLRYCLQRNTLGCGWNGWERNRSILIRCCKLAVCGQWRKSVLPVRWNIGCVEWSTVDGRRTDNKWLCSNHQFKCVRLDTHRKYTRRWVLRIRLRH